MLNYLYTVTTSVSCEQIFSKTKLTEFLKNDTTIVFKSQFVNLTIKYKI